MGFVDMCSGDDEVLGLVLPVEATSDGSCRREFGTSARTELTTIGEQGLVTRCVAESVESICEVLSDCAVPEP